MKRGFRSNRNGDPSRGIPPEIDDLTSDEEEDGVIGSEDEEEENDPDSITVSAPVAHKSGEIGANMLKVVKPRGPEKGADIVNYLMDGYTVVVNIEELERANTVRLVDFLLGAIHVLNGELRRVTKTTLVLSPRIGEMSGDEDRSARRESDEDEGDARRS